MADSVELSLGKSKRVCGYEIKQLPIGRWLAAMRTAQAFLPELTAICAPELAETSLVDFMAGMTNDKFMTIAARAVTLAPGYILKIVAELTGISAETLEDDPELGPVGLIEIVEALIEVNRLGEFPPRLTGLLGMSKTATTSSL